MLVKHSLTDNFSISTQELAIGELVINFRTCGLYTKTPKSLFIQVGNSYRNLSDFSIYSPGVEPGRYSIGLLQFLQVNNELKLTSAYPFIPISSLGNTELNSTTYPTNSYLGITNNLQIGNVEPPQFNLTDLGDVRSLTLNETTHGYVLTAKWDTQSNTKDPFIDNNYYTWLLAPENSRLLKFDDTQENLPKNTYQTLRCFNASEFKGAGIENISLPIAYDATPKLGNNLNSNGYAIQNQTYNTQYLYTNTDLFTLDCNCNLYNVFIVECNNTFVLDIGFSYSFNTQQSFVPIAIIINNFSGAIQFPSYVEFENGKPLSLLGDNHIVNCLVYNTGSNLKVRILQKATNISKAG